LPAGETLCTSWSPCCTKRVQYKLLHELQNHTRYVDTLAVSPNGRLLASAEGSANEQRDYDIRLWDVETGALVHRLTPPRGRADALVFSDDSSRLVSVGGELGGLNEPGEVVLWDLAKGKEVRAFTGHEGKVCSVAISPDGRMLATGGQDKTLRLWEVASGKERGRITGHEDPVLSMEFSPDSRMLAARSSDAPLYLWDIYTTQKAKSADKLTKEDREKLRQRLADTDAAIGFQAVCELIARPSEALTFLEDEWKRLPRASTTQMHKWVQDLSSDQFTVRKTAAVELKRFAAEYEDLLRAAFRQPASLEARQRLEIILSDIDSQRLIFRGRMLEVLEHLRTAPARQFLRALADQKEDATMAREAAAALKRLEQQR
jgi:hypothetical protein